LTGSAVLTLNGTDYLNLEGINLFAEGSCIGALEIGQNCSHNYFGRARLHGPDSLNYESFGAQIKIRNCDNNHLDRVLVSGAYSGVALKTTEVGFQAHNTLIENCTILNARYGIYVDDQVDCMIRNNDIIPGSPSSLSAVCYGIFVTHLNDGGSVEISGNRIHGFADASGSATNRAVGVYSSPGAGGVVTVYNNFIYDFSAVQSLKISGIYLSIGESAVYNNSILIGDTPSSNEISGVLIFAGSANDIRNNIIVCNEPDVVSRGIYALAGSAEISDYNNLYSASPLFHAGAVGLTEYITLEDWRATGFDLNSVALDPHFLASGNLHLDNSFPEFDNLGDAAVPVTVDIDGELRHNPPDIGADEFTYVYTPDPPQSLTLAVDNGTLILRWEPSVGALSYRIYEGDSFDFTPEPFNRIATTSNTFLVHPISEGYQKYYLVKADSTPPPAE
jgi:parallel beta-helix repeat protein